MAAHITTIPSNDRAFAQAVEKFAAEVPDASAEDLEVRLRTLFPRVAIFARVLSGEQARLYAYRDGHYEPTQQDHWWDDPETACVCIDVASGNLSHVSVEWAELMAGDPSALVGRHFTDFVLPDARQAADGLFDAVHGGGEIDTQALLVRPDGSTVALEIHARRVDTEIDVRYRELDSASTLPGTAPVSD